MVAAVRVHKVGGPEVLTYEDIDVPPPAQGQIRVKQHAIGVNFVDTYFRSGLYPAPGGLPFVAGNEAAGEVVEVGPGVSEFKRGDRVAYVQGPGCYTAERNVPADRVGEAAGQHQLRAGRRHDAQRHDGRISRAPHLQG